MLVSAKMAATSAMYLLWIVLLKCFRFGLTFSDISSEVFADNRKGILAAFGDFNSDKLTDIFRLSENRSVIEILIAQRDQPYLQKAGATCDVGAKTITSVVPGDFNGDSMMDVLLTVGDEHALKNDVIIFWGSISNLSCSYTTVCQVEGQPLIMDYNADMIPDIFGENEDKRYIWIASNEKKFKKIDFPPIPDGSLYPLKHPHSCAFVDLDGDGTADLFITAKKRMEYWHSTWSANDSDRFTLSKTLDYPKEFAVIGQSLFVDVDLDGNLEHVIPVCYDSKCENSSIIISEMKEPKWKILFNNFKYNDTVWGFALPEAVKNQQNLFPVTLRFADLDMDGYVDLLAVLSATIDGKLVRKAFVLENIPQSNGEFSRTFSIKWNMEGLHNFDNVYLAAFYDIYENGMMDIILVVKTQKEGWKMVALENNFINDAYFFKVLVLSGYSDCKKMDVAYGTNPPGASVCFKTVRPNGQHQGGCAVQLAQSAHFALQLPYSIFGLGQTPNFVDHLNVVVPGYISQTERRQRDWTQIIPNSQIVIIPCPPNNPSKWTNKLFVTPSHLVILTLAALIGTCVLILLLIGILHWKERREDRREKLQEAHRFHFDAM